MSEVELAAWGTKQGAFVRNWKRRWFVLRRGECVIRYFQGQADTIPKGFITLDGHSSVRENTSKGRANCLEIETSSRTYYIACDSQAEQREWIEKLRTAVHSISHPMKVHVLVVGAAESGKSSLVNAWMGAPFSQAYARTIGATFQRVQGSIDGVPCHLGLVEVSGRNVHWSTAFNYASQAQVAVLAVAADSGESLDAARELLRGLHQVNPRLPICVVVTKIDLPPQPRLISGARLLAKDVGALLLEVSAMQSKNVENCLQLVLQHATKHAAEPFPRVWRTPL